jgi:nucleotide-binding universal stress UspA family protein
MYKPMRIILAIDGSKHSFAAVDSVARRPWPKGTEVKIVHVIEPPPVPFNDAEVSAELFVRARRVFEAALSQFKERDDLRVSTLVLEGSAKQKITEEAEEWQADLIVVGSHGYKAFQRMLLGSVSHAVAQHAKCSVEIVRSNVD